MPHFKILIINNLKYKQRPISYKLRSGTDQCNKYEAENFARMVIFAQ
jgi:hypothetical protein